MKAVSIAALSFLGFDAISTLAEEVKGDPAKQIGRAALITLFVIGLIYLIIMTKMKLSLALSIE